MDDLNSILREIEMIENDSFKVANQERRHKIVIRLLQSAMRVAYQMGDCPFTQGRDKTYWLDLATDIMNLYDKVK